jgi:hypothetical protein
MEPKWTGPTDMPIPAIRKTLNNGKSSVAFQTVPASYPFADAEAKTPPVCLRSHWDPEKIIRMTLPAGPQIPSILEPRPWTKVCMTYTTTQDFEQAPRPADDVVYPSGGTVYPPTRYREAIDEESLLRRLDRPLGTCERNQYTPPLSGDLFRPRATLPDRVQVSDRFIQELSFPMACMRSEPYDCRAQAEQAAWARSPLPFNNATKQDRYQPKVNSIPQVKASL